MSTPKLILAPMAGVTDYAYRTIAAEMGADVTVTEMVSSRALCYDDKKTVKLLRKTPTVFAAHRFSATIPNLWRGLRN